jgi:hypothetical protein
MHQNRFRNTFRTKQINDNFQSITAAGSQLTVKTCTALFLICRAVVELTNLFSVSIKLVHSVIVSQSVYRDPLLYSTFNMKMKRRILNCHTVYSFIRLYFCLPVNHTTNTIGCSIHPSIQPSIYLSIYLLSYLGIKIANI